MSEGGSDPADNIENNEAGVAHRIFDVVAEDPEIEHVADQVHESAVKKHARENGQNGRYGFRYGFHFGREVSGPEDYRGNGSELVYEKFSLLGFQGQLVHEHHGIHNNERHSDHRLYRRRIVVPQWNHRA